MRSLQKSWKKRMKGDNSSHKHHNPFKVSGVKLQDVIYYPWVKMRKDLPWKNI